MKHNKVLIQHDKQILHVPFPQGLDAVYLDIKIVFPSRNVFYVQFGML